MTEPPDAPTPDAPPPDASAPDAPGPDAPDPDAPEPDAPDPDAPEPDAPDPVNRAERRLAAILFADVAGYTTLSSHDEDLALALIKAFQRISRKIVGDKGGRVVKFLGDGLLAEFSSLDSAVNSAQPAVFHAGHQ